MEKPWGYELVWAETPRYVGKVLHIAAGHRLSRQYHRRKDETFLVQAGEMDLEIGDGARRRTLRMKPGDAFHCPPRTIHRMIARTDTDVVEVSTPELDDVVRLEDAYGRQGRGAGAAPPPAGRTPGSAAFVDRRARASTADLTPPRRAR